MLSLERLCSTGSSSLQSMFGPVASLVPAARTDDTQRRDTSGGLTRLRRLDTLHSTVFAAVADPQTLYQRNLRAVNGEVSHDECIGNGSVQVPPVEEMAFGA